MGTLYKRGRIWYFDVRVKGRRIRKRVGPAKRVAELALKEAEVQIAKDEFGFAKNDIAIDEFFNRCLEYSKTQNRERSTERYANVLANFTEFLQLFPNVVFVSEINQELLDRYKVYRRGNGSDGSNGGRRPAKSNTVNFELQILRAMFNLGIKWGYLDANPTKGVTHLKVEDAKPPRFLSEDECRRLLDACPKETYPIYFTFLQTGMRKGEIENLEWGDVDLRRRRIKIRRKADWQPKTGEREIPINDALLDVLKNLKARNDRGRRCHYVFCGPSGGQTKLKLRERLITIAKRAGIANLTSVHTLRHTFASQLVMRGVDLPTVQKLLGHTDIETTMIYAHLAPDHLADAVNRLSFSE